MKSIFIIMFILVSNVYADEPEKRDWSYEETEQETKNFTGDNAPSAKFIRSIEEERQKDLIHRLYLKEKFTYKPFSPDEYQNRKRLGIDK